MLANLPKHELFDAILKLSVRDELVDYRLIRERGQVSLVLFLDHLSRVDTNHIGGNELLAHYINLYNATMLKAVLERYRPDWTPAADDFTVFKEPLVRVSGQTMSLNDLENKIIRPTFKDPRIHAALVCAARSCPPLLPRAYHGDDLDQVLEDNMKRFVNDPSRNQIDHDRRELKLSRIFDWYSDDFGGKDAVAQYVSKYLGRDVSGYTVTFVEYSWELNDTAR